MLQEANAAIKELIQTPVLEAIVSVIPEEWLLEDSDNFTPAEKRIIYTTYLSTRLANIDTLTKEAEDAQ